MQSKKKDREVRGLFFSSDLSDLGKYAVLTCLYLWLQGPGVEPLVHARPAAEKLR